MLVGVHPFSHQNQKKLYEYIMTKKIIFPDPEKHKIRVSEVAKDLIQKVLFW